MNKSIKPVIACAAAVLYCVILLFVAPSQEPYFLLGLGLIGYLAWLYGTLAGLLTALLLLPITLFIYSRFELATSYQGVASSPAYIAVEIMVVVFIGRLHTLYKKCMNQNHELQSLTENLQDKLTDVKELAGIHSYCSDCSKIQNDDNEWLRPDQFLQQKTKMEFSHCICPDCIKKYGTPPDAS